jgi:hypothetical protein
MCGRIPEGGLLPGMGSVDKAFEPNPIGTFAQPPLIARSGSERLDMGVGFSAC